jgi:hypothetical protein
MMGTDEKQKFHFCAEDAAGNGVGRIEGRVGEFRGLG